MSISPLNLTHKIVHGRGLCMLNAHSIMNSTHCLFLTETNIGWQEWISSLRKAFNYIITQWAILLFFLSKPCPSMD